LQEFGRNHYGNTVYFNFEGDNALAEVFENDLDPKRIVLELGILAKKTISATDTLIIFDEIQFCNRAITALKYFTENAPEYHIACAGSLLGVALSRPLSFPVGKVEIMTLKPLCFKEFLLANDERLLVEYFADVQTIAVPEAFENRLEQYYKQYLITGGMPAVVQSWILKKAVADVEEIQQRILDSYYLDFAKHAPANDFPKISAIWSSIPDQLARENKKFMYKTVKDNARAREYENALQWLVDGGMAYMVPLVEQPFLPLAAYFKADYFKLYAHDVGLLRKLASVPVEAVFDNPPEFRQFKGAMIENFALLELLDKVDGRPGFWKSGNTAEIDFVGQLGINIVPFEIKSGLSLRSRSFAEYRKKYQPRLSVKTALKGLNYSDGVLVVPLYLLWTLETYLALVSDKHK